MKKASGKYPFDAFFIPKNGRALVYPNGVFFGKLR